MKACVPSRRFLVTAKSLENLWRCDQSPFWIVSKLSKAGRARPQAPGPCLSVLNLAKPPAIVSTHQLCSKHTESCRGMSLRISRTTSDVGEEVLFPSDLAGLALLVCLFVCCCLQVFAPVILWLPAAGAAGGPALSVQSALFIFRQPQTPRRQLLRGLLIAPSLKPNKPRPQGAAIKPLRGQIIACLCPAPIKKPGRGESVFVSERTTQDGKLKFWWCLHKFTTIFAKNFDNIFDASLKQQHGSVPSRGCHRRSPPSWSTWSFIPCQ